MKLHISYSSWLTIVVGLLHIYPFELKLNEMLTHIIIATSYSVTIKPKVIENQAGTWSGI